MTLPLVRCSGTSFEQGLRHGAELSDRINHNLEVYMDRFERESRLGRPEVLQRAEAYAPAIRRHNPDYYAGMQGIAEGSGVDFAMILALNVRYEIIYYQSMVNALAAEVDGCTSFAVAPGSTANGHLLLGQNWDWIPEVKGAVVQTEEPDGLRTLAFTEAGIFGGKIGLNSAGLGLAVNGLGSTADDWSRLSKPFHVLCYEVLRQTEIEAAVARLTESKRACSANYLIAQAPDQAVNLETAPDNFDKVPWRAGKIVHTNHFLDPAKIDVCEPPSARRPFSVKRLDRMRAMLDGGEPVSVESVKSYLRDHTTAPVGICRHEDPSVPVGEQYRTVTSIIMDLPQQTMHVSDGPPCENDFDALTLN